MASRGIVVDGLTKRFGSVTAVDDLGFEVEVRQTNHEGQLLDWLNAAADDGDPVVLNAGAWTHYSLALYYACAQLVAPLVEVHLSDPASRPEEFRHVSVVTPHADLVVAAAAAGKHVFCEKPMAVTLADADRAIAAARDTGVVLQVGFNRRFAPDWAAVAGTLALGVAATMAVGVLGNLATLRVRPAEALREA